MKPQISTNRLVLAALPLLAMPLSVWAQFDFITNADNTITITSCEDAHGDTVIPNSINGYPVSSIGEKAFYNLPDMTSVTIPYSVTSIGDNPFSYCKSLTSIVVDGANANYASVGGVLFNKALTKLIQYPGGLHGSYAIPGTVTNLGDDAFANCSDLTGVTIPDNVTSVGNNVFFGCPHLVSISVDGANANYANVGGVLFNKAISMLIQYPAGLTGSSYALPDTVTNIGDGGFAYCSSLTNVTIPDGVTSIGNNAFAYCSGLNSVTIPNSVISIGDAAFLGCTNLLSVTIPDSVTKMGDHAFYHCYGLKSIVIGNGVTRIGDYAFTTCCDLISVTIPDSVMSIGEAAFQGCANLTSVITYGSVHNIGDSGSVAGAYQFLDGSEE